MVELFIIFCHALRIWRCKKPVLKPAKCKICKLAYHPSCAKEITKSKVTTCCVNSFTSSISPLNISQSSQVQTSKQPILRPSSFSGSILRKASLSSYKSTNSSPKTPPISSIEDDAVFLSPIQITSPSMMNTGSKENTIAFQTPSVTSAQMISGQSTSNSHPPPSLPTQTQISDVTPDWSKLSLDDKINMLLDMSYKNTISIQTVNINLNKHSEEIKNLAANLNENNNKIVKLSEGLNEVHSTLTEVTKTQVESQKKIAELHTKLNENSTKCQENSNAITLLKSTIDCLTGTPLSQFATGNRMSSQILISGIPNDSNDKRSNEEVVEKIFQKLNIMSLTNDILNIRVFNTNRRQSESNSTPTSRSLILKLKSADICDHIIDVKRRSPKLLVKDISNTNAQTNHNKPVYISKFLHPDLYKFLQKVKGRAKQLKIKYVWTYHGNVYAKKDDDSPRTQSRDKLTVTNSSINVLNLNINSYLAHLAQFEALVDELKPHIIKVVETWLTPDAYISFSDYTILRRDRGLLNTNGHYIRGGGVACFVHNSLKSKLLYSSESQNINDPEFMIIDIIPPTGSHILLSSIYRRPQGKLLDNFFVKFSKYYQLYKNILIMGDLNCDLLKTERPGEHLKSFISESGLYCIPFGPTFHTTEVDSWLDVIIIDNLDKLNSYVKSTSPFIGGHDYLYCNYKLEQKPTNEKLVTFRDFKNCDHDNLRNDLNQKLCLSNINVNDTQPNDLVNHFINSVTYCLDNNAPFETRKLCRPSSPWFTNELKRDFRQRDHLYKQARRSGNANLLALYKIKRKELKTKLTLIRDAYFKQVLENSPQADIWSNLKRMGIIKAKKSSPLDHFEADDLNNYYADILKKHPSCSSDFINNLPNIALRKVNSIFRWTQIDIVDVLKNLQIVLQKSKVDWAKEVGLEVNFSKTKVMILGSNKKLRNLNNWDLPQIIIDAHITRKVYGTLNCLKHRRNILSTSTRKLLVMTTIIPIVKYCSFVLIDLSKRLDYKLQPGQNTLSNHILYTNLKILRKDNSASTLLSEESEISKLFIDWCELNRILFALGERTKGIEFKNTTNEYE
ncbi:Protein of unknown function [Cotesia congregata]|uniref:Endonuclease/exonuclease/phosphatase domain-containing protein n=1 Tax=Cotesia congregata TaxID=51543 RepID=A0A8J2MI27_COTCN|nr:Protein of unknown function [Cotesia congregata]